MRSFFNPAALKRSNITFLILGALSLLPAICHAQTTGGIVVDHLSISTTDVKRSTEFYTKVMHLKETPYPFGDTVHQWFNLGNNVKLHVIKGEVAAAHLKEVHLCFEVPSVKEFAKTLDKLNIPYGNWNGTSKEPTLRLDGVWQLYFQDPDGYWIEIDSPARK